MIVNFLPNYRSIQPQKSIKQNVQYSCLSFSQLNKVNLGYFNKSNKKYLGENTSAFNLKNSFLDKISFGYNFFMKKHEGLHCAYCNTPLLTSKQIKHFSKVLPTAKSNKAIRLVNRYMKHVKGVRVELKKILLNEIKENRDKTVAEIVKDMRREYEPQVVEKQVQFYKFIFAIAKNNLDDNITLKVKKALPPLDKDRIMAIPDDKKNILLKSNRIRYKLFKIKDSLNKLKDQQVIDDLVAITKYLPAAKRDADAYIVKYGNRPQLFSEMLVQPMIATADHIIVKSQGGPNKKENYLNTCGMCNWERGDTSLDQWIESSPAIAKNLKKYFLELEALLKDPNDKRIENKAYYKTYPFEVCETIKKASKGKLDLYNFSQASVS